MPLFVYFIIGASMLMGLFGMISQYKQQQKKLEIERINALNDSGRMSLSEELELSRLRGELQELRNEQATLRKQLAQLMTLVSVPENLGPTKTEFSEQETNDRITARRIAELAEKLNRGPVL